MFSGNFLNAKLFFNMTNTVVRKTIFIKICISESRIITPTKYQSPRITNMQSEPNPVATSREPTVFNMDDSATILPPLVVEYKDSKEMMCLIILFH